jgi:hypothetical protein
MKTLPESMQSSDAYIISEQAPGPAYEYEDISELFFPYCFDLKY